MSDRPPPPPNLVADLCLARAWADEIDDNDRLLLEHAGETIRAMAKRLVRQGMHLERTEAEVSTLRRILYGPQKGGAA